MYMYPSINICVASPDIACGNEARTHTERRDEWRRDQRILPEDRSRAVNATATVVGVYRSNADNLHGSVLGG